MANTVEVWAFLVEWFDPTASLVRSFRLNYFGDGTVELLNEERTKTILKRIPFREISLPMLYVGAAITIHSRQYHVVDYADNGTRTRFEGACGKAFCVVRAGARRHSGAILSAIRNAGFGIADLRTVATDDFGVGGEVVLAVLATASSSSTVNAVREFEKLTEDLAAEFGDIYSSPTPEDVVADAKRFFALPNSSDFSEQSTLCIIKPHVIKEGNLGALVSAVHAGGFSVSCMQMFYLDRECSVEFFDVYREVLPQYGEMVSHLIDGPVVALQLVGDGVVERFREFAGPQNVELAKKLRPGTLRATFGYDFAKNAVHCTDLPQDGALESKFFFQVLAQI